MYSELMTKHFYAEFNEEVFFSTKVWEEILENLEGDFDFTYTMNMQEYYKAYYEDSSCLSFSYSKDGRAVFVFPIFIYKKDGEFIVSSDGENLHEPLYNINVTSAVKKKINKKIYCFLNNVLSDIGVTSYSSVCKESKLSLWHELIMQQSCGDYNLYNYHVDLNLPLSDIKSFIRKSYKPLASKALRTWDYTVHEQCTEQMMQDFRELHFDVSGRITRSERSWRIQADQVNAGEAFLIFIKNSNELIGAALFLYNKASAIYAVAAYKREYFDLPIGHGVQLLAIDFLKEKNVKNYFLGSYHAPWSEGATEKELAIENFKKGFSTHSKTYTVFKSKISNMSSDI